jgi:hypothetical protein
MLNNERSVEYRELVRDADPAARGGRRPAGQRQSCHRYRQCHLNKSLLISMGGNMLCSDVVGKARSRPAHILPLRIVFATGGPITITILL